MSNTNTISAEERMDDMLARYGECCTRTVAARILGRSVGTVSAMLRDGRLETVCGGQMVDVRSVARYICQPKAEDFEAHKRKMMTKHKSSWAV